MLMTANMRANAQLMASALHPSELEPKLRIPLAPPSQTFGFNA
jgi:hypothetical protein